MYNDSAQADVPYCLMSNDGYGFTAEAYYYWVYINPGIRFGLPFSSTHANMLEPSASIIWV